MLTPKDIINVVCQELSLDVDKISITGRQINRQYADGRLIACHLMRRFIQGEKRVITYREISESLGRKKAESSMASVLACIDLLKYDKKFRVKYQSIVEAMEVGGLITIEKNG